MIPGLQQSQPLSSEAGANAPALEGPAARVLGIFREVLLDDAIGPDDSFIDLGGDSFHATRLVTRCTETFRVRLSADLLFRYQTARLLGEAILALQKGEVRTGAGDGLIPLVARCGGSGRSRGPAVFFIPPLYGNSWVFQPLLECVPWDRPAFGCRPADLDAEQNVLDLLSLADYYAATLRAAQPRGPYSIVGYSFGAAVAFEVACRLAAAGEEVRHLVLLEAVLPMNHFRWGSMLKHAYFTTVRTLYARGLIGRPIVRALGFRTMGSHVVLSFSTGPLTADELRMILRLAAPDFARTRDLQALSLAQLCDIVVAHVKSTVSPAVWNKLTTEAGSEDSLAVVKAHKVAIKNVWLTNRYKPRSIFPGTIVHFASPMNADIPRWQPFTTRPMDVRRIDMPAADALGAHSIFLRKPYVERYAEGFRDLFDA